MDFEKLIKNSADTAAKKKALLGFEARQAARDAKFAKEAKKREPKEGFYSHGYDL